MASKQKVETGGHPGPVRRGMCNLWRRIKERFRGNPSKSKHKKTVNTFSECDPATLEPCSSESIHVRENVSSESKKDEIDNFYTISDRTSDVFNFEVLTHSGYIALVEGTKEEASLGDWGHYEKKRNAKEESLSRFENVSIVDDQESSMNVTGHFGVQDNESVSDGDSSSVNTRRKRSPWLREVLPKFRTRSKKSIDTSNASTLKQDTRSGSTSRRDNYGYNAFREYLSQPHIRHTNYTDFICSENSKYPPVKHWPPNIQNLETEKSEEKSPTNSSTADDTQDIAIQKTDTNAVKECKRNYDKFKSPNGETNQKAKVTNYALKFPNPDSVKNELNKKQRKKFQSQKQTLKSVVGRQTTEILVSGEKVQEKHDNPKAGEAESMLDNKDMSLGTDNKGSDTVTIECAKDEVTNGPISTDVPTRLEKTVNEYTFANHIGTKESTNTAVPNCSSAVPVLDMPEGFDRGTEYRMDDRQCIGKCRRGKKTEILPKKLKRKGIPNKHLKNANAYLQEDAINHDLDDMDEPNKSETEEPTEKYPVNRSRNSNGNQRKRKKRPAGRRNRNMNNNCANDEMTSDEENGEESDDDDEDDDFDDDTCLLLQAPNESSAILENIHTHFDLL